MTRTCVAARGVVHTLGVAALLASARARGNPDSCHHGNRSSKQEGRGPQAETGRHVPGGIQSPAGV